MKKNKISNVKYILFLAVAVAAFSSFEVVSKPITEFITPIQLTFYRFLVGGIVLLPFAVLDIKRKSLKLNKKDFAVFAILGFALVCVSMTLSQYGIKLSSASMSAVIFSANPLFVSFLCVPLLNERLSFARVFGIFIGIAGLVITCLHLFDNKNIDINFIFGIVLIFIAMLVFSLYTVMNRRLSSKNGNIVTLSFASIFGAVLLMPIMIFTSDSAVQAFAFEAEPILPQLIYLSVIGTGIAYYCYFTALSFLNTSIGSMSFLIKPALASVLCSIFLGEDITNNVIIGIIFIMLGLSISIFAPTRITIKKLKGESIYGKKTNKSFKTSPCNQKQNSE